MLKTATAVFGAAAAAAVLGILALAATGCSAPEEHDTVYHADLAFSTEERAEILKAAHLLSEHTGQPVEIVFDGVDAERTITRDAAPCTGGVNHRTKFPAAAAAVHGWGTAWSTQHIHAGVGTTGSWPEKSTAAQDLATIVAHELGHGLGLGHVEDNANALMAPVWAPGGFKWTAEDQQQADAARARGWVW